MIGCTTTTTKHTANDVTTVVRVCKHTHTFNLQRIHNTREGINQSINRFLQPSVNSIKYKLNFQDQYQDKERSRDFI